MKFSIQEEGSEAPDKQIFFTFKEASEKTGILFKFIACLEKLAKILIIVYFLL